MYTFEIYIFLGWLALRFTTILASYSSFYTGHAFFSVHFSQQPEQLFTWEFHGDTLILSGYVPKQLWNKEF